MASNLPPGRFRSQWGFSRWRGHDPAAWSALIKEAKEQQVRGESLILGHDADPEAVATARHNCRQLGLKRLTIRCQPLSELSRPDGPAGLLITNPPYGSRMGEGDLVGLYRYLGDVLRQRMLGYTAGVFSPAGPLSKSVGLRSSHRHVLHNGPLDCRLLIFEISPHAPQSH